MSSMTSILRNVLFIHLLIAVVQSDCQGSEVIMASSGPETLAVVNCEGKKWLVTACAKRSGRESPTEAAILCWQIGSNDKLFRPMRIKKLETSGLSLGVKRRRPFSPLGICVVHDGDYGSSGRGTWMYVTNPRKGKEHSSIEVFKVTCDSSGQLELEWIEAIMPWNSKNEPVRFSGTQQDLLNQSKAGIGMSFLKLSNAVAATRSGIVYASNSDYSCSALLRGSVRSPKTNVDRAEPADRDTIVFCRPGKYGWSVAANRLGGANGLALSSDETVLMASAYHANRVLLFRRTANTPWLHFPDNQMPPHHLGFHPDNVACSADGSITVAGQCSIISTILHALTLRLWPCKSGWAEFDANGATIRQGIAPMGPTATSSLVRLEKRYYFSGVLSNKVVVIDEPLLMNESVTSNLSPRRGR